MCQFGSVFSSNLKNCWRCLLLNRTLGKQNIIFWCHEEYYNASGSNFKRSRKEERYKTSITRERASLHFFHNVLIFLPHKMATASYTSFIKSRLSCTALKKKKCMTKFWAQMSVTYLHSCQWNFTNTHKMTALYFMFYGSYLFWVTIGIHNRWMLLHRSFQPHED